MELLTSAELKAALRRATGRQWEQLMLLVGPLAKPESEDEYESLVASLLAHPELVPGLRLWVAISGSEAGNTISGSAQFTGTTVQAREIHGGIHLASSHPAHPAPRQFPRSSGELVGRAGAVARLEELRRESGRDDPLVVVTGPAGVGKTTLVLHWLRGLADEYPDGQLYVDLRGHEMESAAGAGEVLGGFLRALGITAVPPDQAEQASLWRSLSDGKRLMVLFDNALSAAQVRPLLPASGRSLVAVTSRLRLSGLQLDGAGLLRLGLLGPSASAALLRDRIGPDRVAAEPGPARQVVDLCAGLPLALCVAAARVVTSPSQAIADTAAALDREADRLTELRVEGERAVQGALDASYRVLAERAADLYGRLGQVPFADFPAELVAAVAGEPWRRTAELVEMLTGIHLLEESGTGRYRFHDLVRLHARSVGAAGPEVLRRAVEWYLASATETEALITPSHRTLERTYRESPVEPRRFATESEALRWLGAEQYQLMAALRGAEERGWPEYVWQLADAMWPLFLRLRPYGIWLEALERGLAASRAVGDRAAEARMLTSGGGALRALGRHTEAAEWYREALVLALADGNRRDEAQARHGAGQSEFLAGRHEEAVAELAVALAIREEIGYPRGAALTRVVLGEVRQALGEPEAAVDLFGSARAGLLAVGDRYDAARALALLGRANGAAGAEALAGEQLSSALAEFEEAGSVQWQARCREFLGELAETAGRPGAARRWYEEALELYRSLHAPDVSRLTEKLEQPSD
ncbi:ATP-binding protein [Kitasatospora sp. NPDC001664]